MRLEETLFSQALKCPPSELADFLDRECRGDANLRRRLSELIEMHSQPDVLPDSPFEFSRPEPTSNFEKVDSLLGRRIGHYILWEKIGEGGSGIVYVAEQTEPVRRRVALKLIKPGMDSKAVIARFEAERQALALMDHPNIAKVLDGGTTDEGRPYFVMELVTGMKITQHCDHHRLSTPERLRLFASVCQAVQHAHLKGVIHRDLKPSNVFVTMVDGKPVPKVIDFGIAKAIGTVKLTDLTIYTALDQFVGTPAYMSPEQAERREQAIDTRTDIYSLGVLLYELLTGRTPFDTKALLDAGIECMLRTIREQEPRRPSTQLRTLDDATLTSLALVRKCEPQRLIQSVCGDLDWIVIKCLEKERDRRYGSAEILSDEIQRFLSNQPISARPPSVAYRAQKFLRRNRVTAVITTVILVILLVSGGIITWQTRRAKEAQQFVDALRFAREQAAMTSGRTNIVTALEDGVPGSLRRRVKESTKGDCIQFAPELSGKTILLTQGVIPLDTSVKIDGSNLRHPVRISGNRASRIFNVPANQVVHLNSLVLTEGRDSAITTSGLLTMKNCEVSHSVGNFGGGFFQDDGVLLLDGCLIVSNTASVDGGGVFNTSLHRGMASVNNRTVLQIQNSTIAHNSATKAEGGGLKSFMGSLVLINCTIVSNTTSAKGGGLRAYGALFTMSNTIIDGNSGGDQEDRDISLEGTHLGGGNNLIGKDARLLPLGKYGGVTMTMPPTASSPAVDMGDDAVTNTLVVDQRGFPRHAGNGVDIGAAEFRGAEYPEPTVAEIIGSASSPPQTAGLFGTHSPGAFDERTALVGRLIELGELEAAEVILRINHLDLSVPNVVGNREFFRRELGRFVKAIAQGKDASRADQWARKLDLFDTPFALDMPPSMPPLDFYGQIGRFKNALALATNRIEDSFDGGILLQKYCGLWLEGGDVVTYSNRCSEAFFRLHNSENLAVIRRVAKSALMYPLSDDVIKRAGEMADYAISPERLTETYRLSTMHLKCLADYRRGRFEPCLEMAGDLLDLARARVDPDSDNTRTIATASLLRAMCQKRLGKLNAAQATLVEARGQFQEVWNRVGRQDLGREWHEMLMLHALFREAVALIGLPSVAGGGHKEKGNAAKPSDAAANPVFVVTNAADSGPGTLRQLIADAPAGVTITFAPALSGNIVRLKRGPIEISKTLTINGATLPRAVSFDGNQISRVFIIRAGASVVFDSLVVTNGLSGEHGGGILNEGDLTLNACAIIGNRAQAGGGGLATGPGQNAHLKLVNCTVAKNIATFGAGILHQNGTLNLTHATVTANDGVGGTGGIVFSEGQARIQNSIVAGNTNRDNNWDTDFGGENTKVTLAGRNLLGRNARFFSYPPGSPNDSGQFVGSAEAPLSPRLAPLGDYGGPTPTMPPQPDSPALDNGDDAIAKDIRSDQRGFRRRVGLHADIGAVEAQ